WAPRTTTSTTHSTPSHRPVPIPPPDSHPSESTAMEKLPPNFDVLISVCAVIDRTATQVEEFVIETASILSQSYRYFELLLIDNGSEPETVGLIPSLQQRLPNIRMIRLSREYSKEI